MSDYREMWAGLGLDVKMHEALLAGLGAGYQQIFLSQKNRPEAMQYFDFVMSEVHGLRIQELLDAKAEGRIVVGSFCVFVPEELILAVDGISVGLCTGADFGVDLAEKILPRNTCALIKSAFGFNLSKVCPYMASSDIIVGENTCDGKKKSYEEFGKLVDNLYVMDLPQTKSMEGKALLRAEYKRLMKALEEKSGKKITMESLKKAIEIVNNKRKAVHRLALLRAADPSPLSGLDGLLINQIFFYDNPLRFTDSVNKLCDELEERIAKKAGVFPQGTPRLLVSGCPMAVPNWKLPSIIETSGAVIVGEESCVGERGTRNETCTCGESIEDLLENIVERYFNIDCAIFTPNPDRKNHIVEMAKKYKADGVVHYALQFCQPYDIESHNVEKELESEGIPVLNLVTDYSGEDVGQLSTRIEAFIERIKE
ncbi:MAG TPA: double-cubane-cluster-containing anaerobic reductase [Candidatus Cloacimonadota bacterium]|nr:double-cubane-cluster-containing anaerobic reductase [Candidatus Cloacimonadota bacterium]